MTDRRFLLLGSVLFLTLIGVLTMAGASRAANQATVTLTRLFFQDHSERALRWADVTLDGKGRLGLSRVSEIAGFKKLDIAKQKLVQMGESHGLLLVGVRDEDDGQFESGWVLINSGVTHEDHGDHGHWRYKRKPSVVDSRLDKYQGNPAHLYIYDGVFYLANDKLNGYTRIDPGEYEANDQTKRLGTPRFISGGGNHITLAVVENRVGYSCWIDGGGPNKGRVDVTPVNGTNTSAPAYSFYLPTGAIHGAIANSGKVFFAPADGICWVHADLNATLKPEEVKVHHIPLGSYEDRPLRTGAFVNHEHYVIFVTGRESSAALVLLNARLDNPEPIVVPIPCKKENRLVSPAVVRTARGRSLAFVFHDHDRSVQAEDFLTIVDLDPNQDGHCADAKILRTIPVGPSLVEGHFGHHDIAFDADKRWAFFTNPGSGTISVLSLDDLTIKGEFKVGGVPTHIIARGGAETED
ncbi:MAG: hypothetical protein NZM31_14370 [Gemmatales bacterium]|nr:hypothetical protein [Gemmatales bacterium]MDW8388180.1 hypothetical protein [Gemmatales bacterium]